MVAHVDRRVKMTKIIQILVVLLVSVTLTGGALAERGTSGQDGGYSSEDQGKKMQKNSKSSKHN